MSLPTSWALTTVGELCSALQYGYTASATTDAVGPRFLRITDIQNGRVEWSGVPFCDIETRQMDKYSLKDGDIVFARTGGTVGKSYIIDRVPQRAVFASYLIRLSAAQGINPRFLYYFFQSASYWEQIGLKKGGLQGNVNATTLSSLVIPLCPANEQRRIVAKIEELFSELDKGIESLTVAREQLKAYRQSLFKDAFEGKLTAEWRGKNEPKTASELRKRIQFELLNCHERTLESWRLAVDSWGKSVRKGKRPSKPRTPQPALEITPSDVAGLPTLPEGWTWVRLGELVWSVKDGPHFSPKYSSGGIPFISGGNIRPDGIDFSTAKFISPELHRMLSERCKPEKGDLLYTKGGTTGIARVNDYNEEFNVWVHVAVLKIIPSIRPFYLQHALNSPRCYAQSQKYTHGVGNQDLGLTRMINIVLPLCGLEEQERIEKLISHAEAELKAVDLALENELKRSNVLRQSVLRAAFSGKLVSQESGDEPASVLLERIRAEREAKSSKPKKTSKHTKEEAA